MDKIIKEIFNRDSRTTVSPCTVKKQPTNLDCYEEICDKNQKNYFTNEPTLRSVGCYRKCSKRLVNYLTVALSIYFILSTNQSEASPITKSKRTHSGVRVFDHKCGLSLSERSTIMDDKALEARLRAILLSCKDSLSQTEDLSRAYIRVMWNTSIEEHHEAWKSRKVPSWIHPEGVPLKKQYSENISAEHKSELEAIQWKDHQKVFEYLGKIYQRLERIYVGVQIVNKWIEMAKIKPDMLRPNELKKSEILFQNVTQGINNVLCDIQTLFKDVSIDPTTDLDITPFKMDDYIKINHWLIYREYQNLMEYSNELLKLILARYGG